MTDKTLQIIQRAQTGDRQAFAALFEQYKKALTRNIIASAPDQFTAGTQDQGDVVQPGVESGQYNQQFVQRVGEVVDDKVDLLFGPIAKMLVSKWKVISTEITNELKVQTKEKQASGAKPATTTSASTTSA